MDKGIPGRSLVSPSGAIGVSAIPAVLTALMPKCPICWMTLMSALGLSSMINADWLRPLAILFLMFPVAALIIRARRFGGYGPFILGAAAASALYIFKFEFSYDPGVYLSGVALVSASLWNARRKSRDKVGCRC